MATQPAPPADKPLPAEERRSPPVVGDIRSAKPYVFSPLNRRVVLLRGASFLCLVALDLTGLGLALYGALALREVYYGNTPILWGLLWDAETQWLPFLALITVLVFWQAGLYAAREQRSGFGRVVSSLLIVALLTLAFGLGTGHKFATFGLIPTTLVVSALLIGLFRASYDVVTREVLHMLGVRRRAIIAGEDENLLLLYRTLGRGRGGIDYEFVGAVAASPGGVNLPVLGQIGDLRAILAEHPADELIVTDSDFSEGELLELVEQSHRSGVKVRIAPKTTELLTQRGEYVPGQGVPLFELRPPVFVGADWVLKRSFDLVVATFVLLVGSPVWILIAAAIKMTSRGPVFYRDRRVGLGEQEFGMLKFRTMLADAPARQAELEKENEAEGALFKIREDPRVTGVGQLLRRFSMDEIPNLWNVLRGEMSLVGPRPLPIRDYERLEPWHRKRYLVLPGMTGLWQISGRSELSFDDLVRYDFYYLDNWSIWLDVSILAKTIPAVVAQRGAY
ncbi:MAG: sugar transferase [Candidatus Rokuibacteriota bacterium]|nr:MAG: sugar transferase [Candidatus Rokubacteria bacterium]